MAAADPGASAATSSGGSAVALPLVRFSRKSGSAASTSNPTERSTSAAVRSGRSRLAREDVALRLQPRARGRALAEASPLALELRDLRGEPGDDLIAHDLREQPGVPARHLLVERLLLHAPALRPGERVVQVGEL